MTVKNCIICGKPFKSHSKVHQLCSKECRRENDRRYQLKYRQKNKPTPAPEDTQEKKPIKPKHSMDFILKVAEEKKITYGQAVAFIDKGVLI